MPKKTYLVQGEHWKVSAPKDFGQFLRCLYRVMPSGSILYLEASETPIQLKTSLDSLQTDTSAKLPRGTLLPTPDIFHVPITQQNLNTLANIIEQSSGVMPTHIQVYCNESILLQWFDADCADPIFISRQVAKDEVQEFCNSLGCEFSEM